MMLAGLERLEPGVACGLVAVEIGQVRLEGDWESWANTPGVNPRSDEELKARRQARRSEQGQRLILTFGALLTIAALGVGAAVLLEARAVTTVSDDLERGVVTIAAPSFAGAPESGVTRLSNDDRSRLQADLVLDASMGGGSGEISVRRIGGTEVAVLRLARKAIGKKGLSGSRELVREASFEADLVVVVLEGKPRGESVEGAAKGAMNHARVAHALIDSGADLVVARGRTAVGGLEWYKDRLIAYQLNGTLDDGAARSAVTGANGVLEVTLTEAGSWIDGRVLSMDDDGAAGIGADAVDDAFGALRAQSRAHFGSSAVRVAPSGSLQPPTSEHT